jgi:hypothetical protein
VEEWQAAAAALRSGPASTSGSGAGKQLLALYEVLVALPDPQPALQGATALAAKVTGGWRCGAGGGGGAA